MFALIVWLLSMQSASGQAPVPQPFPRPNQPARPAQPAPPSPGPASPTQPPPPSSAPATAPRGQGDTEQAPSELMLGVPIYPGAQFIRSYDAGRGQRYYIFGSTASFVDLVTYYRSVLKQRGELVYEIPATHEFDVGNTTRTPWRFRQASLSRTTSQRCRRVIPIRSRVGSRRGFRR